jgi:murein DD-endopeptidase MepM/ murein hydrolase activator NlpD
MGGAAVMTMKRFPVRTGPATRVQFAQRFEMGVHEGIDVFGPAGAELIAVADGKVRQTKNEKGGFVVYLEEPDGTRYYYAHLDAFAYPLPEGERRNVKAGDVLGYMGTSGNAKGKAPHLHFEWRPGGGAKRDPFPVLTRLAAAEETRLVPPPRKRQAPPAPAPPKRARSRKAPAPAPRAPAFQLPGGALLLLLGLYFMSRKGAR